MEVLKIFLVVYVIVAILMMFVVERQTKDSTDKLRKEGKNEVSIFFLKVWVHFIVSIIFTLPVFGVAIIVWMLLS